MRFPFTPYAYATRHEELIFRLFISSPMPPFLCQVEINEIRHCTSADTAAYCHVAFSPYASRRYACWLKRGGKGMGDKHSRCRHVDFFRHASAPTPLRLRHVFFADGFR